MTIDAKPIARAALASGALLLIPLVAMRFTDDMAWSPFDFAFMGALLFGTFLAFTLVARRATSPAQRAAVALALATGFLLVWVNASVGIIGAPGGPNVLYLGVLALGLVGALCGAVPPDTDGMAAVRDGARAAAGAARRVARHGARAFSAPPGTWGVLALNAGFARRSRHVRAALPSLRRSGNAAHLTATFDPEGAATRAAPDPASPRRHEHVLGAVADASAAPRTRTRDCRP
jgi:hypothetical protein